MSHLVDVFVNGVELKFQFFFPLLELDAFLVYGDRHLLVFALQLHIEVKVKKGGWMTYTLLF